MKKTLVIALVAVVGFASGGVWFSKRHVARHAAELAELQAAWQAEKAELEAAVEGARGRVRFIAAPGAATVVETVGSARLSPAELIGKLRGLKVSEGAGQARNVRQAIYWFEDLIAAGPAALPAIREFLARNEDLELDASWFQGKASRDRLPGDFILPPSLRFGLFDAVRQIGGAEAEKVLSEVLGATGRGIEVAWLTRALHELAPNQYRDQALAVARDLLAGSFTINAPDALDRNHRDYLYGVLAFYNDASYTSTAQSQLVRPDGAVDRSALRYLQQTLGAQSVPIAAQAYQDPRLATPDVKEPLARLALNFVGADAQANQFYQQAINDTSLSGEHRKDLIEDLNQDGFVNKKGLTASDLPLIQNRLALIEQLAPNALDQINAAAFKEAYKDLLKMRERIITASAQAK